MFSLSLEEPVSPCRANGEILPSCSNRAEVMRLEVEWWLTFRSEPRGRHPHFAALQPLDTGEFGEVAVESAKR
jgi:hypothetical protein